MKKQNKQNGITLIALVITIIILIILAGISISQLAGSGLFERAQEAKEETYKAQVKEEITLAITELTMSYYNGEDVQEGETLDDYIARKLNGYTTTSGATLTYDSDNKKIVYTDKKGNVTNVTVDDKWNVTVEGTTDNPGSSNVAVSSIVLNKESTIIEKGRTETLTATVEPDNATNKEIVWSSENETIATVENGVVTAVSEGTTTIKATAQDGSDVVGSCEVTVMMKTALENAEAAKPAGATITVTDESQGIVMVDSKNNEWVWIEVPKTIFKNAKSADAYNDIKTDLIEYAKDYREGSSGQGCNWTDEWYARDGNTLISASTTGLTDTQKALSNGCGLTYNQYQEAYQKMLSSVYTNGGFWISRYEIGDSTATANNTARTGSSGTTGIAVSQANMIPYSNVKCREAQTLASGMSTDSNKTSSLLFGIQWDLVCKFLQEKGGLSVAEIKGGDNTGRTNWGNYNNVTVTSIKTGAKQWLSGGWTASTTDKPASSSILLTTGASEQTNKMNIYDFAGNVNEWTLEYATSGTYGPCAIRGGDFWCYGSSSPASDRDDYSLSSWTEVIGFRSALY